jgi:hypothetical protein
MGRNGVPPNKPLDPTKTRVTILCSLLGCPVRVFAGQRQLRWAALKSMSSPPPWYLRLLIGVTSASVAGFLLASLLLLFDPVASLEKWIMAAAWVTFRLSPFLVPFGAVLGLLFFRRSPLTIGRLIIVASLAISCAVVAHLTIGAVQYSRWQRRVIGPELPQGTTEAQIRDTLGKPTKIELSPNFGFSRSEQDCAKGAAAKRLLYIPSSGGQYRVLSLDKDGQLICESNGWIHYWF